MAYEVTKQISGRSYRYRVESMLDPQSGKRRNRWTYLGRDTSASAGTVERKAAAPRGDARRRLLDALEALLAERDYADVTADAIAVRAGLAHGTFYRHFKDKRAALLAALERVSERRRPMFEALIAEPPRSDAEARAGLRQLFAAVLRAPDEHPALQRAWLLLVERDADFSRERCARREHGVQKLGNYFRTLAGAGFADISDPEATASALLAMIEGFHRTAVIDGMPLDAARLEAAVTLAERAVFGAPPRR
jgi:AcrR family transcriptional regulator